MAGAKHTCCTERTSKGRKSREVGQRHLPHFLEVDGWCAVGLAILAGESATTEQRQDGTASAKSWRGSLEGEIPGG